MCLSSHCNSKWSSARVVESEVGAGDSACHPAPAAQANECTASLQGQVKSVYAHPSAWFIWRLFISHIIQNYGLEGVTEKQQQIRPLLCADLDLGAGQR